MFGASHAGLTNSANSFDEWNGIEQTPGCVDFFVLPIGVTVTFVVPTNGLTGSLGVALAATLFKVPWDGRRSGKDV